MPACSGRWRRWVGLALVVMATLCGVMLLRQATTTEMSDAATQGTQGLDLAMRAFANVWCLEEDRAALRETMRVVSEWLDGAGVTWMLAWGSLLGCVRVGTMMPWDDDIDIAVAASDWHIVEAAMENGSAPLHVTKRGGFWRRDSRAAWRGEGRASTGLYWPSGDLFKFEPQGPSSIRIWGQNEWTFDDVPTTFVYPLWRSRFADVQVWVPRYAPGVLESYFRDWAKNAVMGSWNHRMGCFFNLTGLDKVAVTDMEIALRASQLSCQSKSWSRIGSCM